MTQINGSSINFNVTVSIPEYSRELSELKEHQLKTLKRINDLDSNRIMIASRKLGGIDSDYFFTLEEIVSTSKELKSTGLNYIHCMEELGNAIKSIADKLDAEIKEKEKERIEIETKTNQEIMKMFKISSSLTCLNSTELVVNPENKEILGVNDIHDLSKINSSSIKKIEEFQVEGVFLDRPEYLLLKEVKDVFFSLNSSGTNYKECVRVLSETIDKLIDRLEERAHIQKELKQKRDTQDNEEVMKNFRKLVGL